MHDSIHRKVNFWRTAPLIYIKGHQDQKGPLQKSKGTVSPKAGRLARLTRPN
jgi:hypothetical protein